MSTVRRSKPELQALPTASSERDKLWPKLFVTGVSHHTQPLEFREKFGLSTAKSQVLLERLLSTGYVAEAVVNSTCNRLEVIWSSQSPEPAHGLQSWVEEMISDVAEFKKLPEGFFYNLRDIEAVRHLFRVASGLDSMVVGENQIMGQLKKAFEQSQARGGVNGFLNRVFDKSFAVSKEIRTDTKVGERSLSVCSVARELAQQIKGENLKGCKVLLIGAGETGRLALTHFCSAGVEEPLVANRSPEKAKEVAERFKGEAISLDSVSKRLAEADIVIGASTLEMGDPVLVKESEALVAIKSRKSEAQLYLDLGVPRNFASKIENIEDVFLYNVDHLQEVVAHNLGCRRDEVENAERIIAQAVKKFEKWWELRLVEPLIFGAIENFEAVRLGEVKRSMKRLKKVGLNEEQMSEVQSALDRLSKSLVSRALSGPIDALKKDADNRQSVFDTFRRFFTG